MVIAALAITGAFLAIFASGAAIVSAHHWLTASRISHIPGSAEPVDQIAAAHWHVAGLQDAAVDASELNAQAARWSAVAALLYGLSGLFAAIPIIWRWLANT